MHSMPTQFTPPPRRVPVSLALLNVFGLFSQVGWFVFGFGMLFFWIFVGNSDFSYITLRNPERTTGKVTRVEATGASENEVTVIANHYEYSVAGRRLTGTSYTTGNGASEGEEVTVEYKPADPAKSRIAGMRTGQFGKGVLFVVIFPLVGFLILYFSSRGGLKRARLLKTGLFTTGKLIDKEPTNMTVNKQRVYELTFEFTARDGRRCEAKARTHMPERLQDEHEEPLLYDPENPSEAFLLDELPSRPEINGVGELVGRPVAGALALLLPALVIGGHVLYFYAKLN
jgi:Protein of unknown function (DUF3592)